MIKQPLKTLQTLVDDAIAKGVHSPDDVRSAVPLIFDVVGRVGSLRNTLQILQRSLDELTGLATEYSRNNFDEVFDEVVYDKSVTKGFLRVEGRLFRFVDGYSGYTRTDPRENMGADLTAILPPEMTKTTTEFDPTSVKRLKLSEEDLLAYRLMRKPYRRWYEKN